MRARLAVVLIATAMLAACGSTSNKQATPSSTSTTTAPPKIDVRSRQVPEKPDAAYINAVFVELMHVVGDTRRDVYANQTMSQATYDRLADVYAGSHLSGAVKAFSASSEVEHPDSNAVPGDEKVTVISILDSQKDCIVVSATNDWNAIYKQPKTPDTWVYELDYFPNPNRNNPTPWKVTFETPFKQELLEGYTCENLKSQSQPA